MTQLSAIASNFPKNVHEERITDGEFTVLAAICHAARCVVACSAVCARAGDD
jgi:hypothetical protein